MSDAITRNESLLKSIADGTSSSLKPITREEQYLAYIAGETNSFPLEPITREEAFLDKIAKSGVGGGSSINVQPLIVTENGTWDAPEGQAYDPVTVDVKAVTEPITITENGVYPVPKGTVAPKFGTDWKFKEVITIEEMLAVASHYEPFDDAGTLIHIVYEGNDFTTSYKMGVAIMIADLDVIFDQPNLGTIYGIMYHVTNYTRYYFDVSLATEEGRNMFADLMGESMDETGWNDHHNVGLESTITLTIPLVPESSGINPEYVAPLFDVPGGKALDGWGEITVNVASGGESGQLCEGDFYEEGCIKFLVWLPEGRTTVTVSYRQDYSVPVIVDWGDGVTDSQEFNGSGQHATHTYEKAGYKIIKLSSTKPETIVVGIGTAYQAAVRLACSQYREGGYLIKAYVGVGAKLQHSAFYHEYALVSVELNDNVKFSNEYIFANCKSLRSITIPSAVTTIYGYTFRGCTMLTKIVIPPSVTAIRSGAFETCYAMKTYDFSQHTTVPTLDANVFSNIADDCEILVPSALYDEWIVATNWATYASKIKAV